MSLSRELAFHLKDYLGMGLSGASLENQGNLLQILSPYAHYVTGAPTEGQKIDHLLKAPRSQWYGGRDPLRTQETSSGVNRHYAFWANMMTPVSFDFLELQKNTGLTSFEVLHEDFSLSMMTQTDQRAFYNLLETRYQQAVYGGLMDLENALWGRYEPEDPEDRVPESLAAIFDENGSLHGLGPEGLGKFDSRHALGRGDPDFPDWEYVHKPRVYYFNSTDGRGGKPPDGTAKKVLTRENIFQEMEKFLRPWDLIVSGHKAIPLNYRVLGLLAENDKITDNDKFSITTHSGLGWMETKKVVSMHNTVMFEEVNAPRDEMWGLHLGSPGGMTGSFYPVFWEGTVAAKGRQQIDRLVAKASITPPGYAMFGRVKPIPFWHDEIMRFTGQADSGGSNIRVMVMFICQERWCQTKGVGWEIDDS